MRPNIAKTMLDIACILSLRATCRKLQVGCVLVDQRNKIIGTGYNGVPHDMPHCTDSPCAGAHAPKGADLCEAVHAEPNALLQCPDVRKIETAFLTHAPCMRCTKLLLNTSCSTIVFIDATHEEQPARELWQRANRIWFEIGAENSGRIGA